MKDDLNTILAAALKAAEPGEAVRRHARCDGTKLVVGDRAFDLADFADIVLIAVGKAAVPMAGAAAEILGGRIARGLVVTKYGHASVGREPIDVRHLEIIESAHPVPDENSLRAGNRVCNLLANCTQHTLVIACISGGASALMIAPPPGISLNTLRAVNDALLKSGADIREMNAVRSRLDRLKGGRLARLAAPGTVIGLILSDVIGDPLDVIASGLTNDPRAHNVLVANNTQACQSAAAAARALGYETRVVTTDLRGEARERGREIARAITSAGLDGIAGRTCMIYGGETTVTVRGDGQGGRNQELALAAAIEFDRLQTGALIGACVVAALGTDGTDGPTDAAGAVGAPGTLQRARLLGLDAENYLARNDSYRFFSPLGDLIMTGPTGTNVADVVIALRMDRLQSTPKPTGLSEV